MIHLRLATRAGFFRLMYATGIHSATMVQFLLVAVRSDHFHFVSLALLKKLEKVSRARTYKRRSVVT